ncbi:MAG: hypothetical protein GF330_07950 [Candidatus Eisenbacteria bacterium]|nr:hypothetical protein [Candidatus Eisenbacteria bacterium]
MRQAIQWGAAAGILLVALVGLAQPVAFEPDARLGDRQVDLHWMPDPDDPVFTGNLRLFKLGEVVVAEEEVAYLLSPSEAQEFWALGRWGDLVARLVQDDDGQWVVDGTLDPLPAGSEVLCSGIHPLGILIAAGLADGSIAVWRPSITSAPTIYRGHAAPCRAITFKPLSSDLDTSYVSVGDDGFWKEWGRPGALSDSVDAGQGAPLLSVGITREADEIAVGSDAGEISIWPLEFTGNPVPRRVIEGHNGLAITRLVFNETAERLASADENGGVRVWDAARGTELGAYEPPEPATLRLAYGPREGRYIAYAQSDGIIGLLDGYTARAYQSKDTLDVNIGGFAISGDGLQGYFGTADGRVEWWYQGECIPSVATPRCFGGYRIWRARTPEEEDLELLRVFDFGDSTWNWLSTDTLRSFSDPESIIARGGDTLSVPSGPHNGVPYYYSLTKYYWEFLDGGRFRVPENTKEAGLYRTEADGPPVGLVPRVEAVTRVPTLADVFVVPNPYVENEDPSRFGPLSGPLVRFFNLPSRATVRIYTSNGERVRTLEHPQAASSVSGGSLAWDLENDYGEAVASGVYLYSVRTPDGESATGFFTIVR